MPSSREDQAQNVQAMLFSDVQGKKLQLQFDAPEVSSDAGMLILREVEMHTEFIKNFAKSCADKRNQSYVKHSQEELITQRVLQICNGYPDCNDADSLKNDPALKVAVGRSIEDDALGSQSTLSRLDNSFNKPNLMRMAYALGENFLNGFSKEPETIIIDMDPTVNKTYGGQQMALFNGFVDDYCLMPFHVFDGITGQLITTVLRPGTTPSGTEIVTVLKRIERQIRSRFKKTTLIFRADSHHCRHEVLDFLEKKKMKFVIGLPPNSVLNGIFRRYADAAKYSADLDWKKVRSFHQTHYAAGTWSKEYRVVARVQATPTGTDLRYVVTNMEEISAKNLYEVLYCDRANAELMIKDSKLGLNSDRMSCHTMQANQFRMLLHGVGYQLMHSLRANYLQGTSLATAMFDTIRLKLLKVAGRFVVGKRTIKLHLPDSSPVKSLYARVAAISAHLTLT
jgi:hypothetical protein